MICSMIIIKQKENLKGKMNMSIESLISFFYAVFQPNYYFAKSAKEAGQILLCSVSL